MFSIIYFVSVYFKFVCFVFFRIVLILLCIRPTFFCRLQRIFFVNYFVYLMRCVKLFHLLWLICFSFPMKKKVSFGLIEIVVGINSVLQLALMFLGTFGVICLIFVSVFSQNNLVLIGVCICLSIILFYFIDFLYRCMCMYFVCIVR